MEKRQISLHGIPPTLNQYTKLRSDRKQMWHQQVIAAFSNKDRAWLRQFQHYFVFFRFFFGDQNRRDVTNLYGAVKLIEDALVKEGLLMDDSTQYLYPLAVPAGFDQYHPRVEMSFYPVPHLQFVQSQKWIQHVVQMP